MHIMLNTSSQFTHGFLLLEKYRMEQPDLIFFFLACNYHEVTLMPTIFQFVFKRIPYLKPYEKCRKQLILLFLTLIFHQSFSLNVNIAFSSH